MTAEGDVESNVHKKRKSLLEKYELPVDHLDFGYIENCKNIKEIEKIVKVLRSKDEGYFPDLLKCAEEKLKSFNSNHRLLRTDAPVMTKSSFSKEEWNSIADDIEDWKGDMASKDMVLNSTPKTCIKTFPEVRKSTVGLAKDSKAERSGNKTIRISGCDYKSWDKYDADEECEKMDLEDKKRELEKKREKDIPEIKKVPEKSIEDLAYESVAGFVDNLTQEERETLANKEREIGNEYYKTNHLNDAIRHYTRCIHIHPTCKGYNNRAATYLKQCKFNKALEDLNVALELDSTDVKARYRRAIALQHKNQFQLALEDVREVLRIEPNHVIARHLADQLRENCASLPKKHKLMIQDKDNPGDIRVSEVTQEEMLRDFKDVDFIEVNDWGLPKIMCNCNGKYSDEPGIRHEEHVRFQHIRSRMRNHTSPSHVTEIKKPPEIVQAKKRNLEPEAPVAKKLDIVELDKIPEEESKSEETQKKTLEDSTVTSPRSCIIKDKRIPKYNNVNILPPKIMNDSQTPETQKNNTESIKINKTSQNLNIQDSDEAKGLKEMYADFSKCVGLSDCGCGDQSQLSPYQIIEIWNQQFSETDEQFKMQASFLRSICPQHLTLAIGNKLEEKMLSTLLKCLYYSFDHKTEIDLVKKYYSAIINLDRFKIIELFLREEDKKMVRELKNVMGVLGSNSNHENLYS